MYSPSHFDEMRLDVLHTLVHEHPLGALVTLRADGLCADHIPFEIAAPSADAPFGVLRAHVARANPLWRQDGEKALVVFQGPSAYVWPSLYEEERVSGKVAPTYNYAVVQAHGTVRAIEDALWLLALLERLTDRHEGAREAPWQIGAASPAYIEAMLKAIVGIEIAMERIEGKWKISQNRSAQDQANVAAQLAEEHSSAPMAALMRAHPA